MSNLVVQDPIAIIGMACMFPKAPGLKAYWHVIRAGVDCITDVPDTHWKVEDYHHPDPKKPDRTYCRRGGFISPVAFDPTEFSMPPSAIEATDTSQILGLVAAKAALEDAGYGSQRVFARERTSVVLGVTGCLELVIPLGARLGHPVWRKALRECGVADDLAEQVVERISDSYVPWQENSFPGLLGNVVAGRIANRLNLRGTNCVVDAACASSHAAAHLGIMELSSGRADMVVAGGVDTFNDIFMYMCFSKTPALSTSGEIRPFSDNADGTLLGEGIGVVVLKRLEHAQRDGDRVYAVIRGVGTSSDGEGSAIYAPASEGQKRALQNAYEVSGVEPRTVELVEAHGTGTKVGDVVEFNALREVFGHEASDTGWCALGTVKSQIGHTKAAAGAAGLIKTAMALHWKVLPPTLKVGTPNPKMEIERSPFYLNTQLRPWLSPTGHPRRAALSSFGFGGSNYHMVLEEASPERADVAWDGSVELFAWSAATRPELEAQLAESRTRATRETGAESWARQAVELRQRFSFAHAHRLVAVVDLGGGEDLVAVLDEAVQKVAGTAAARPGSSRVFYGEGAAPGKVAFLFSGQGSQYLGMGRDLACMFPEMLAALEGADAATPEGELAPGRAVFPIPALRPEVEEEQKQALTRTDRAQPALGAVEVGCLGILERFGLAADFVGGHSYGELPALYAAGRLDLEALHSLSRLRGSLMAEASAERAGSMVAVAAPWEEVQRLLERKHIHVTMANRNSPVQTVLSGPHEALDLAAAVCRDAGLSVQPLRVSAAFHSPLMAQARPRFRRALDDAAFVPSRIPVYSNVTGVPYPDEANECRKLLADQLICPVDFVGQVEHMFDSGARVFIEVGPRSVLCGLVRATLGERGALALAMDASQGRGSGLVDLARLLAQCAALGLDVRLSAWESVPGPLRKKKMEVSLVGANYRSPRPEKPKVSAPAASTSPARTAPSVPAPSIPAPLPVAPAPAVLPVAPPPVAAAPPAPVTRAVPADLLHEAFQSVQGSLSAMATLQQQTAAIHQRFLEGQEAAQRTFHQALEGQQRLVEAMLGMRPAGSTPSPVPVHAAMPVPAPVAAAPRPVVAAPVPAPVPVAVAAPVVAPVPVAVAPPAPAAPPVVEAPPATSGAQEVILAVVAEKTGYPTEMLSLDMELEADLGIDSIKRVEILAAVEERLPGATHLETERIGTLRSLRQVMDVMAPGAGAARVSPVAAPTAPAPAAPTGGAAAGAAEDALVGVVADKTGYPREMLSLDMELEADLGIDSIKRVEILAALEERLPGLRKVETERVGSLRTLRQVVEAMASPPVEAPSPPPSAAQPVAAAPTTEPASSLERRVLRAAVEVAAPSRFCVAAGHEIRVCDDGTPLAAAIAQALAEDGLAVRMVPLCEATREQSAPLGGLLIVAPPTLEGAQGIGFLKEAFQQVAAAVPALRRAAEGGGALLATVARMDGRFGLAGQPFDPLQGGLAGLPKTLSQELPQVRCRALDVSAGWADVSAAAHAVARELQCVAPLEAGLDAGSRIVLETVPEDVAPSSHAALAKGDVVVVTGGARGVTAAVATTLAAHAQPTLVLLGRSPAPQAEPAWLQGVTGEAELKRRLLQNGFNGKAPSPAEIEREYRRVAANREIVETLARIRATGSRVEYVPVDVRDEAAVAAAIASIRGTVGPIRGLIHGAGVLADKRLEDKTREQFDLVFDTKVVGLQNLLRAMAGDDLRVLVLFSSVTARYGRPGQVDYCMANDVLNKMATREASRRPQCRVVSMNWGPWAGGMVTDGLRKEFARLGVGLIPLEAGARCLVAELGHAGREVEVLIGDGFPAPAAPVVTGAPGMTAVLEMSLSLATHPFLGSHCLGGRPVVPMALIVEWMGHAALHAHAGLRFHGVDDLRVVKGISLEGDVTPIRFMAAPPVPGPGDELRVEMEIRGAGDMVHARGTVVLVSKLPVPPENGRAHPHPDRGYPHSLPEVYESLLFHGPHLHAFHSIDGIGTSGMTADLKAAPRPQEWMQQPPRSEWLGDPLALDGGLQMGLLWCFEEMGEPSLPMAGRRYRQYRRFPRRGVRALLEVRSNGTRKFIGDVSFMEGDQLVASCEGFEFVADSSLAKAFGHPVRESTKV